MAKRNQLTHWGDDAWGRGKTLEQWQQDVNTFCKADGQRRCKQVIAMTASEQHPTNISNLDLNYRCYVARWATMQFFDPTPDASGRDEDYDNHKRAVQDAWSAVEDCLRFIDQEYRRRDNVVKKALGREKRAEEERRAMANRAKIQESPIGDIEAVSANLPADSIAWVDKKFPKIHDS